MATREKIVVIGRGKNGWHAAGVGVSTPNSSSTFSTTGGELEDYLAEAGEDVLVYDAAEVEYGAWSDMVITGPMIKVDLPQGQMDRFTDKQRQTMGRMMGPGGLEGDFASLAKLALSGFSSLDFVAPDVYMALLKALPGIKLGKVKDHKVVWE